MHQWKKRCAALLACALAFGGQLTAQAAEFDPAQQGSLTITLATEEKTETQGTLALYQVAEVQLDHEGYTYCFTQDFADCGLSLDQVGAADLAQAMADYAAGLDAIPVTQELNEAGQVTFPELELGVYLVVQTQAETGFSKADPFLVTIPQIEGEDFVYQVDATPKVAGVFETETEGSGRPQETPTPEETPTVTETPTPEETPAVTETPGVETTPVTPSNPSTPSSTGTSTGSKLPQTGQLNWPIPLMTVSGLLFFALGWWMRRRAEA